MGCKLEKIKWKEGKQSYIRLFSSPSDFFFLLLSRNFSSDFSTNNGNITTYVSKIMLNSAQKPTKIWGLLSSRKINETFYPYQFIFLFKKSKFVNNDSFFIAKIPVPWKQFGFITASSFKLLFSHVLKRI